MLYFEKDPRIIVSDELTSFLHPGVASILLEEFARNPHHQLIFSTHSPIGITSPAVSRVIHLSRRHGASFATSMDLSSKQATTDLLSDLGVRVADLFGFDRVLWAEGPTEEACFPLILQQHAPELLSGLVVRGVIATGDFESTDQEKVEFVLQVYRKIADGYPMPVRVGVLFDPELRRPEKRRDLERRGDATVRFLNRRMFENYFLDAEAISALLEALGLSLSNERILARLQDEDLQTCDGKQTLKEIFKEASDNGDSPYRYHEVEHGKWLTRWLLEKGKLADLAGEIRGVLDLAV